MPGIGSGIRTGMGASGGGGGAGRSLRYRDLGRRGSLKNRGGSRSRSPQEPGRAPGAGTPAAGAGGGRLGHRGGRRGRCGWGAGAGAAGAGAARRGGSRRGGRGRAAHRRLAGWRSPVKRPAPSHRRRRSPPTRCQPAGRTCALIARADELGRSSVRAGVGIVEIVGDQRVGQGAFASVPAGISSSRGPPRTGR